MEQGMRWHLGGWLCIVLACIMAAHWVWLSSPFAVPRSLSHCTVLPRYHSDSAYCTNIRFTLIDMGLWRYPKTAVGFLSPKRLNRTCLSFHRSSTARSGKWAKWIYEVDAETFLLYYDPIIALFPTFGDATRQIMLRLNINFQYMLLPELLLGLRQEWLA
jgi:hypothetical protein